MTNSDTADPLGDGSADDDVVRSTTSRVRPLAGAVGVASILGVATAYGQFWLPAHVAPLANSAGTWCAAAFVLSLPAPGRRVAAASGALALLALLAGYVLGAASRGDPSSRSLILFWGLAAVVAGPALGVAARSVVAGTSYPAAVGVSVLGGVLAGEGVYGLTLLSETTPAPYWCAQIAVGVGVVAVIAARRLHGAGPRATAFTTAGVVAASFVGVYALDPMVLLS